MNEKYHTILETQQKLQIKLTTKKKSLVKILSQIKTLVSQLVVVSNFHAKMAKTPSLVNIR